MQDGTSALKLDQSSRHARPRVAKKAWISRHERYFNGGRFKHTDGGGLDHVTNGKSLDCLVFGGASAAVGAADRLYMAAALLVASAM